MTGPRPGLGPELATARVEKHRKEVRVAANFRNAFGESTSCPFDAVGNLIPAGLGKEPDRLVPAGFALVLIHFK